MNVRGCLTVLFGLLLVQSFILHKTIDSLVNPSSYASSLRRGSQQTTGETTVLIDGGSCVYGATRDFGGPHLCVHPKNRSHQVRVVFDSGVDPDARIYYARDVQENRAPGCDRGPHPAKSTAINILWTEESTQIDRFLHTNLMNAFGIFLSFDPRQQPGQVFSNFGFVHLMKRIHTPVTPPSQRMSVAKKGGLVVWTASNCNAVSHRLQYLKELNKLVPVHSLGKCWNTFSPAAKTKGSFQGLTSHAADEWEMMGRTYKFWFSAENFLCDGYVTEKWWLPFAFGSVPVLYGTAVHADYAPAPDSFVDARKFSSAAALGKLLLQLDSDDAAYMRYHAWRKRDVSKLNPKFVQLQHRFAWGVDNSHEPYASMPAGGGDAWICHVAAEVLRQQHAEAQGKQRAKLLALPTCKDPKGKGIRVS
jgi:hypothetical protein